MRAVAPLALVVSASTLLYGCSDTSGPEPPSPPVLLLTVAPSSAVINAGRSVRLTARLVEAGVVTALPIKVTWRSSDPYVAEVQEGGMVHGRRDGYAQIIARWGTLSGRAQVTVVHGMRKPKSVE